jgi:hypothetical protein
MSLEDVVKKKLAQRQENAVKEYLNNLNTQAQKGNDVQEGLEFVKASQGNVGQAIGGTAADIGLSLARGFTSVSEGLADALIYLGAGIAELHGKKAYAAALRNDTQVNLTDQLLRVKAVEDNSVLGRTSQGILEGVGQGIATVATGAVGGAGLSGATMFVSGTGHGMTEALQEGATANEAALYGLISGGVDAITEALAGGLGKGAKALGISKGIAGIDDKIASVLSKNVKNKLVSNLIQAGVKATGEGVEEALSYAGQTLAKKMTYLSEKDWNELWSNQELLENFVAGTLSSAILQAPDVVTSTKRGQDFVTGRSGDEQAVIDKLYKDRVAAQETDGKKLTTKEKGKILDQVEQEYERGEIAVETIEEALGGDTYQKYVEAEKQRKDLQTEFDDLNGMKKGEMTGVQEDRLQELRQQLKTMSEEDAAGKLQKQYQEEVRQKASKGQLAESYNQREQRGQAYKADLAQYNEKQRATVQKAMDSGILNNTRKSHDFVDLIAKISEDTGADFDFTDNQRLKESGFAMDGITVNGYTNGKTVSVNINSAKALNTVVGHEIMHVLEGTELANKLQERILAYADSKGELKTRKDALQKLYQNMEADIDKELTADLVGDYIFGDIDFIRDLKTGDRDLFQRIYDEVKHLVKLATAGSKEARELERIKKMFADVYREADGQKITEAQNEKGLNATQEVDYSLSRDTEFSDNAIAKNKTTNEVAPEVMEAAKTVRSKIADRMNEISEKGLVTLPEDKEGDTFFSNSSYGGSEENTTICPRSLAPEAFVNAVSEMIGRPLTVQEQIYVGQDLMNKLGSSEELKGQGLSPECTYCYVAMDRKAQRQFLGEYIKQRDAVLEQLKKNPSMDASKLHRDHRALAEHFKNKQSADPELSELGKIYKEFLDGRKPTKNTYKRFKMWYDTFKSGKPMIDGSHLANMEKLMGDIGEEFGEELKPQIADALDYAQKASWAKKRVGYVAYNGHILKWKQDRIDKLNSHYGLRMYSFSDFHPAFVLENMQMITDAAVRGLKMLGYTKDLDFVDIFAPTGMNINISTFGFNAGGKVYENSIMGASWEAAQKLRQQYPNVGITYVATDDTQVRWAMEQEWIDVVIPYHMVRTGAEIAEHFGYTNYTQESADTKKKSWKKGQHEASIAPTQHNNDLETYLTELAKNELEPRFDRFRFNEDGTPNPNYMKLVNECRRSAAESTPVKPIFNEDAAMRVMAKLEANGYYQPIGGSVERMYEIAADVAEDMGNNVKLSLSEETESRPANDTKGIYGSDVALEGKVAAPVRQTPAKIEAPVVKQTEAKKVEAPETPKTVEAPVQEKAKIEAPAKEQKAETEAQETVEGRPLPENYEAKAPKEGMQPVVSPVVKLTQNTRNVEKAQMSQEEAEYYKEKEGKTVKTFRELMTIKAENLVKNIADTRVAKQKAAADFDAKIQKVRAGFGEIEAKAKNMAKMITETREAKQTAEAEYDAKIQQLQEEYDEKKNKRTAVAAQLLQSISRNKRLKNNRMAEYDAKIKKLQTDYNALKNRETKSSNKMEQRISELEKQKSDRLAEYNKRLYDLQKRVERTEERILNDTGREDYIRSKIEAIDEKLKAEKDQLLEKQTKEREDLERKTESRETYIAERAMELYEELRKLKKGVKASEDLGFLLDQGYSWNAIKSALLLVNDKPAGGLNTRFEAEKTVRELLGRRYEDAMEDVQLLEQTQANELQKLEDEAKDRRAALQAALIKKQRMEQYEGEAEMLVGDSGGWKDMKTGMGYATQTMRRYMRDIVRDLEGNQQIEKADAITDYLQGTYNLNEAAMKLEARKRKEKFAALKLNKYESAYAQMLGEMKYGPGGDEKSTLEYDAVTYLEAFKDKINLEKVEQAVEMARAEYEELFVLINQTLRSQGFREMPYRKGYFPHFTDKTQNFVQKLLNWKPNTDEIPTSIAGRTEEFKPQRSWQSFIQKRKGIRTDYDLLKGYDNYLNGALDWIYHIADIQRMRAFENFLRYTHSEEGVQAKIEEIKDNLDFTAEETQDEIDKVIKNYKNPLNNLVVELRRKTNTLAAKKSAFDRETEEYMGRPSYSMLTNITSRASANQVAGNLASALTNVIPIIQSSAEVSPKWTFEAVKETLKSTQNDDGMIERSTFLTNRLRQNESLIKNNWDKIGDVLSIPMEYMDAFASQVVWRSKYLQNKKKGMTETEAIKNADQFAENVIAGRSRGNMPTIFDSKNILFKTFTAFQLEVANQYGYFFKDLPTKWKKEAAAEKKANGGKTPAKTIAKATAGVASVLMGSYVYNWVAEAITGNASATDPIRILEKIIRQAIREIEDDDEETTGKEIASVFKTALTEILEEVPYVGGPLGGGRISSAAAMPYGSIQDLLQNLPDDVGEGNWKRLGKELLNVLYYGVLPMGGGQLKKINEGIGMYLDTSEEFPFLPKVAETPGSYTTSGGMRYAVEPTVWNVIQSVLFGQYANENARRYFDEGKTPLSEKQVEEFQSVDMDMDEYWDYRDALKEAGSKTADKIDVVMGLDLPIDQKNLLANNIANRKDPIDLTGAEMFDGFAEFDFYMQHRKKYEFLKSNGVTVKEYETMEEAAKALEEYKPDSAEMQSFLKKNDLTLAECEDLKREKEWLDFRYESPEKYKFLSSQGIRAEDYMAMDEEEKAQFDMLRESPKKLEFLKENGISAQEYESMDEAEKEDLDFRYSNPEKYDFLKKEGITVAAYKDFDKTTKEAWDWAANNQKKYDFLKQEGITMDEYKMLSEGAKDDWKWAANNPEKYRMSKAVTENLHEYRRYQDKIAGISGDKKQEKIWAYISSLDIAEGAKALLFKQKYPANDKYNRQVVQYVIGLDMTYTEKKQILTQLGFQVDSNGKITG